MIFFVAYFGNSLRDANVGRLVFTLTATTLEHPIFQAPFEVKIGENCAQLAIVEDKLQVFR
jgi:hypothetical protein